MLLRFHFHDAAVLARLLTQAAAALLVQLLFVRPRLTKRSDAVLAGRDGPRSHPHRLYIGLEVVKVIALIIAGILLLST